MPRNIPAHDLYDPKLSRLEELASVIYPLSTGLSYYELSSPETHLASFLLE